jgi:hypothetical protein
LLAIRALYRRKWQQHAKQHWGPGVNQAAVARVLAGHQQAAGQTPPERTRARRMKDLVSRALSGHVLSPGTLELFIDAFTMSPPDADELRALLDPARSAVSGPAAPRRAAPREVLEAGPAETSPPLYRTVSWHEVRSFGPDGLPRVTRTVHVIRAVQRLTGYPFLLDPGAHRLEVIRGGTAGPIHRRGPRAAVDIEFHRPLLPGDTGSLEYVCRFQPGAVTSPRFRRGTRSRLENVELQVRFHWLQLPERVWWTVWPDETTERPARREPVHLDQDGTAHRFVEAVERQAVGFSWQFRR